MSSLDIIGDKLSIVLMISLIVIVVTNNEE